MKPYFYTLKALWDDQGKIKMYYVMPRVKKNYQGKGLLLETKVIFPSRTDR